MSEKLDRQSLMNVAKSAYMNRDRPDIEEQGIKHNYNELVKLIDKLDKTIWIKEFWYNMYAHIGKKFPGQIKIGYTHALPVEAVRDWGELVKKHL